MDIALIGLPQSGKTTVLNALTRGRAESGTYGGARQEVHVGVARMSDPRLDTLAQMFGPDKVVPVEIKYSDVPVGSGGRGDDGGIVGQFLNLLQNSDALLHVARLFDDPSVPHIRGSVDSNRDTVDMEAELASSDLGILEGRSQRIEASLKGARDLERDMLLREGSFVQRLKDGLENDVPVREQQVAQDEADILSNYQLLTAKPLLTVFNIGESQLAHEAALREELARRTDRTGVGSTTLCGKLEYELSQLSPEDEAEFRDSMGLRESGVDRVVRFSCSLLSLVSFFTYVSKEVRAWSVPAHTTAVKAAGKIHSDMERGFIRAEVIALDDLAACGSLADAKKKGLLRREGKTYQVQDGDVITFLFNV